MLLIHGMKTHGEWQEHLAWQTALIYRATVPVFEHKYGWDIVSPFIGVLQRRRVDALARRLQTLQQDLKRNGREGTCDVIAHSFGTLIVTRLLEDKRYQDIHIGRLVLTASIARTDTPFARFVADGRVERVLNHRGGRDAIVQLAPWFVPHAGNSGRVGFASGECVDDVFEESLTHGGFFGERLISSMNDVWVPFLAGRSHSGVSCSALTMTKARDASVWTLVLGWSAVAWFLCACVTLGWGLS
ncbi:MAG: hypothetical protein ACYC7F_00980 [Gemmatimonadaceae bacterium]